MARNSHHYSEATILVDAGTHVASDAALSLDMIISTSSWDSSDPSVFATATTQDRGRLAVNTALQGLIDAYQFLGDQLALEWGLLTQEDFDQIANAYLRTMETANSETIRAMMNDFLDAVDLDPDPDLLSRMFRCKIEDATAVQKARRRRANASIG